jgi:hypothetical protein
LITHYLPPHKNRSLAGNRKAFGVISEKNAVDTAFFLTCDLDITQIASIAAPNLIFGARTRLQGSP